MSSVQSLPWCDPLALAACVREPYWALLYSGAAPGRQSLLAHRIAQRIEGGDWQALARVLTQDKPTLENSWFGTLGYGLRHALERLPADAPGAFDLPDMVMMRPGSIHRFDHEARTLEHWQENDGERLAPAAPGPLPAAPAIAALHSNMSRADYLAKAAGVIGRIHAGELYQANLTRKFGGRFAAAPDAFGLFRRLCHASPGAYSAYLRLGDTHILSSSPELFLSIAAGGHMRARPIKGSRPRSDDAAKDAALRRALAESGKDRAENLMIVDLMRHDFARSCVAGSVAVPELFSVTSHATIHHMASEITGQIRPEAGTLAAIMGCFPPGSMTGAPKIRAMTLIGGLERQARGVYSGAIGWLGGDGSAQLSVVIRTLIVRGDRFEFQVGGGIVAESTPEAELSELLDKTTGIGRALGIERSALAAL